MDKELRKKIEERKNNKYFVSFEMGSGFSNAFIRFRESITDNEVYAVCYPSLIRVMTIKVDGVDYEIDGYINGLQVRNIETNKLVKSKDKIKYLQDVANYIIREGNKYLKNTFGNIDKEVLELIEEE